jgi:DNA polymerase-1
LSERRLEVLRASKFDPAKYETIGSLERLAHWIARAHDTGVLALKTETTSLDPMQTTLCGIALAVAPNEAAYLPLGHRDASEGEASGLFAAKLCTGQIAERDALGPLKSILEDASVVKVGHDVKRDRLVLACRGIRLGATDDTMLMSYVLDAGKTSHDTESIATRYLGRIPSRFNDVKSKDRALFTPDADCAYRRLCRRRRRRNPASLAGLEATYGRRESGQRLRDVGAADAAGSCKHGGARNFGRPKRAIATLQRLRKETGNA